MDNYNKYKALKEQLDVVYKRIRFNRVLAVHIWGWANGSFALRFIHLAYFFLSLNLKDFKTCTRTQPILATYGLANRKDHQQLFYGIIDKLENKAVVNNFLQFRKKLTIHIGIIHFFIKEIFLRLQGTEFSFITKLAIAANFVYFANILHEIEKLDLRNVSKYLSFCDMMDIENMLTQYMKKNNVRTMSLQHGVYRVFKTNVGCVQVENIETDCLLSWGQYTVDEFVAYGIPKERLKVAGYPKMAKGIPMKRNNTFSKAIVLLAWISYEESNMRLLEILKKNCDKMSFSLKLHPSCNFEKYRPRIDDTNISILDRQKTINECLNNKEYDFAIAVNTTTYYEALMRGLPCIRFYDGTFDTEYGFSDVFTDSTTFWDVINSIKSMSNEEYQQCVNETLKYAVGFGLDNYRDIILSD